MTTDRTRVERASLQIGVALLVALASAGATSAAEKAVQVMVLGSYHMDNPGRDVHNLEADDVLTPKRQNELEELVTRLARFQPTKIAVEVPFSSSGDDGAKDRKHSGFLDRYQDYLQGEMEPNRNEVVQVGFRLAKKLGHPRLYGIDAPGPFPYGALSAWAQEHGQRQRLDDSRKVAEAFLKEMGDLLKENSIRECFSVFNTPEFALRTHQSYIEYFAPIGEGEEYPGADLVEGWYGRNLRIFVNLGRIAEPGDRILVLYGAGHSYYLRQLTLEAPGFELVEPVPYLESAISK
ncbi:MAG: hypothetical protein K0U98_25095 [Deltaproteobacteria bacterium]|nr:hypothetical protein [Deltaproteobacteria bacterium]